MQVAGALALDLAAGGDWQADRLDEHDRLRIEFVFFGDRCAYRADHFVKIGFAMIAFDLMCDD